MCGEQPLRPYSPRRSPGSPPRVRGTDLPRLIQLAVFGITPACAGNSVRDAFAPAAKKDHPRVCGEQSTKDDIHLVFEGSPPRVRGTVGSCRQRGFGHGITPACAGNRGEDGYQPHVAEDHPRVCGEQVSASNILQDIGGSPPRVRGTVTSFFVIRHPPGITPACAGNRAMRRYSAMRR